MKYLLTFLMMILPMSNFANAMKNLAPYEVREIINERIMDIEADTPCVHSVTDIVITRENRSTPLRIYTPSGATNLPMILMIHGGGWIAGNLDTHDNMARYLCSHSEAMVVSVDYLNSPEGKFPLPLEQCYDALLWMVQHAQELQGDACKVAVVGDSAGGNMAAALCLMDRDRKGPPILLQVLINPSPDLTLKHEMMAWYASQYVKDKNDMNHPYASPGLASDLSKLPKALIILAEKDDLFESGNQYAEKLRQAGVLVDVYTQKGIGHLAGNGARASLVAQESLDVAVIVLLGAFHRK